MMIRATIDGKTRVYDTERHEWVAYDSDDTLLHDAMADACALWDTLRDNLRGFPVAWELPIGLADRIERYRSAQPIPYQLTATGEEAD